MISPETIEKIREVAQVSEVAIACGLELKKTSQGFEALCPFHPDDSPSFKIKTSENFYKCFGCGNADNAIGFVQKYKNFDFIQSITFIANHYKIPLETSQQPKQQEKLYVRPDFKNHTELSDATVKWFKDKRGISQPTLITMKVTDSKRWGPEVKKKKKDPNGNEIIKTIVEKGERTFINFNYFRDGELINVKFRDGAKIMSMVKDAELIFYNLDSVKGAHTVYITEGEIDALTLIECGIQQPGIGVVSVPNGANVKSNNMVYIDNCIELFEKVQKIIICTDNDIAGRKLREDLAMRFGKEERCYYIDFKDKKDINDVLISYGAKGVRECVNAVKEFPLEGAFTISDFSDEIDDMYINGMDRGSALGMGAIDKLIRFVEGYITVVTGVPNHGKSDALDQIILKLMTKHGWKVGFYSPENRPTKLHFSKLARKLIGKNWFGDNKMSEMEKNAVKTYLEGKVWFIKPEKDFTIESILKHAKMLKMKKGINCFVVDAWNRLEHKFGKGTNETTYINETLLKIDGFCEANHMHCFLVVHPSKQAKDKKTGMIEVPNLYSLSGSAHFYNIIANGITIYRDFLKGVTEWHVQKVKFSHWGTLGMVKFKYDNESGRYYEDSIIDTPDRSNWITENQTQAKLDVVEQTETTETIFVDDGSEPPF